MDTQNGHIYEFDSFRVDAAKRLLLRDGEVVPLTPKAFEILLVLVENGGRVMEKDELLNAVWPDTVVEENNLSVNVSALRKALGESPHEHRYIVTVPGHGYRFVAGVKSVSENSAEPGVGDHAAPRPVVNGEQEPSDRKDEDDRTVRAKRLWLGRLAAVTVAALVLAAAVLFYYSRRGPALTDKDTILLADFVNTTGDPVFDDTLKQALAVQLEQSPSLSIFPEQQTRETLRYMGRPPDERVTKDTAREICERRGIKALLVGSISNLGSRYVVGLEATDARTGDVIAREQLEAESKEQVLRTLAQAANQMREKLGESLGSIEKFNTPLQQATTSSLEALRAYSLGSEGIINNGKYAEAIPFFKRAVELDPKFASAYARLSLAYYNSGQRGLAVEYAQKAFELRERVSERERFYIESRYYSDATGEINKAVETYELWKQTYPRDVVPLINVSARYLEIGQYEKVIENIREAIRLYPTIPAAVPQRNLGEAYMRLSRFAEASDFLEHALRQNFESTAIHAFLYQIAFVRRDAAATQQQLDWAKGQPDEYVALDWQAESASFAGQWGRVQEFSRRSIDLATGGDAKEVAAGYVASQALRSAAFGRCVQAKAAAARWLTLDRGESKPERAALALALCGEADRAQRLAAESVKRHPRGTLLSGIWLPTIRAATELQRGDAARAIEELQPAGRYEAAAEFWPQYLRGQAHLKLDRGAEAATEFQKILDHRGEAPLSALYPLAHLGLARAAALTGNIAESRQAYEDFFELWKDADPDIPILQEAKREYEKLK